MNNEAMTNGTLDEKQQRFLRLFLPLQARLERFALVLTRDRESARDVVSETVLRAFDKLDALRHDEAFLSYLFSIATRVYRRSHAREQHFEQHDSNMLDALSLPGPESESSHDIALLHAAIAKLDEAYREALVMSELVGFSAKEIAEVQGCSSANVRVRVYRAKKQLTRLLRNASEDAAAVTAAERDEQLVPPTQHNANNDLSQPLPSGDTL